MNINKNLLRACLTCILLTNTILCQAQEENLETIFDIHHLFGYLVAAFLIMTFVMIFSNRIIIFREQDVIKESERLNAQLSLIMDSNKTEAWTYNIEKGLFMAINGSDSKELLYTPIDFSQFYDRDDFKSIQKAIVNVKEGNSLSETISVKSASSKDSTIIQHFYEITITTLRRNRRGNPIVMLGTQRDITEERQRAENTKKLMLRYHTVFNSSLVDMIFYDANGILTDINSKAMETFNVDDVNSLLEEKVNITDIPSYRELDIQTLEPMHLSSITDITKVKQTDERVPQVNLEGTIYYEANLEPIRDENNNLQGIVVAGRDITDMVESNHHQKEASLLLEHRTKDIQAYIQNINYALKVSNVRLINYFPEKHEMEFSNDLSHIQYKLSQLRATSLVHKEDKPKAEQLLLRMDRHHKVSFSETIHTLLHDKQGRDVYLNFKLMPVMDKTGDVTHYLGMCRDETEIVYTEKRLQEETAKAQEAEQLKNTFLLNMSYELRTPLNAVIGFAELFGTEHNEEDEPIFAEEIKKNTNSLLKLINDILFISRLDAKMIEFNYQMSDFALLFEGWCYNGWSNLNPNVKKVVENPYTSLVVNIDQLNLSLALQKLCLYSGQNTQEGLVRAKYEYRHGELMITIEDTGKGMDEETLKKAFDRFVQKSEQKSESTGLDLPIVKELVEQMNGTLELQSEPGKGNTFFISIPCEMSNIEKKAEIII